MDIYDQHERLLKLSPRELICLEWVKQGKTAEETAMILGLKPITVKSYLRNIRYKLNCTTIAQAVYKALKFKFITL